LQSLSKAAGRDLGQISGSILDQGGIPLVKVTVQCPTSGPPVAQITQQRFTGIGSPADANTRWRLPVCIRWSDGRECVELSQERQEFTLKTAKACPQWIHANENGAGYYRTLYEEPWLSRLGGAAQALSAAEVALMLQDVRALVSAGRMDPGDAILAARPFANSSDADIALSAIGVVAGLEYFVPEDAKDKYSQLIQAWFGDRARKLGWNRKPEDSVDTQRIRASLVPFVATSGRDELLRKEAEQLASRWLQDRKSLNPEMAPSVLSTAASQGKRTFFSRLVEALRTSSDPSDRFTMLGALARFSDPEIVSSSLELILNGGQGIDAREMQRMLFFGYEPQVAPVVWNYVKKNFDELNAKLPGARGIPFGATLPTAARLCDEAGAADLEAFFATRISGLSGGKQNLDTALENVRLCSARKAALQPAMRKFLTTRVN
jgi:aminopeptidase N